MEKILYNGKELLSPKLDLVFKALFGKEDGKSILRPFLNSVLDLNIQSPDDITLTNTEITPEIAVGKLSRLDVCAMVKNGDSDEHIDIEIQLSNHGNMLKRSVYYVAKLFSSQLEESERYDKLGRAIGLSILDFNIFDDKRFLHRGRLKDTENGVEFTDCFELNFVEMPKLEHKLTTTNERLQWLMFLNVKNEEELKMLVKENSGIATAVNRLERVSSNAELMHQLIVREKSERDYYNDISYAEERGEIRGIAIGEQRGREEGMQQGREEAILATARAMKQGGLSNTEIAKFTRLSIEQIEKL